MRREELGESAAAEAWRHKTDALHASIAASRKVRDGHQGGTPVRTNGPDLAAELVGRDQRAAERAEPSRSNGYAALDQRRGIGHCGHRTLAVDGEHHGDPLPLADD